MLGYPNDQVWRSELACGHVLLLQSPPHEPPAGVYICPEDEQMTSITAVKRWDQHLADRLREQRASGT